MAPQESTGIPWKLFCSIIALLFWPMADFTLHRRCANPAIVIGMAALNYPRRPHSTTHGVAPD